MHVVSRPPLLVMVGPTGVGKTAVAVRLARQIADGGRRARTRARSTAAWTSAPASPPRRSARRCRIICSTSWIPTSATTPRASAPTRSRPSRRCSGRGRLPVVVGGTGLYVRALLRGPRPRAARRSRAAGHAGRLRGRARRARAARPARRGGARRRAPPASQRSGPRGPRARGPRAGPARSRGTPEAGDWAGTTAPGGS